MQCKYARQWHGRNHDTWVPQTAGVLCCVLPQGSGGVQRSYEAVLVGADRARGEPAWLHSQAAADSWHWCWGSNLLLASGISQGHLTVVLCCTYIIVHTSVTSPAQHQ